MRALSVVIFVITLTYLVESGSCGVIDNVYGSVENGTRAIRDRVSGYWSYGKDMLFGSEIQNNNAETTPRNDTVAKPDRGIIGGLYSHVVNGYRAARSRLHDLFIDQEDGKDKGVINTLYGRVHRRIAQLKSFVVGDEIKSTELVTNQGNPPNIVVLRRTLTDFLKAQGDKSIRGVDTIRSGAENAGHKLQEGFDDAKNGLYEYSHDTGKRINDGVHSANTIVSDKVENVKHDLGDSFSNLQKNMNDLTDKEKEILNSISTRLRNRVSNVYEEIRNNGEDIKQLSYADTRNEV